MRARFRSGIQAPRVNDWVAPFELVYSISGATLEGHLRQIATETLARPHLDVLLPMGISFYTFVSMSSTIDAYRKQLTPERSFMRFSLFVCYFPHLVAGPIIRPDNFFPTLGDAWRFSSARVISGFNLCLNGL